MAYWWCIVTAGVLLQIYNSSGQNLDESSYSNCEVDNCLECFNRLAYETLYPSQNQLNLQKAFFPPDEAPPVFVIITYNYKFPNGSIEKREKTWFWSASTYYIYQPLAMLQFTSLFFADPEFRTKELALTLPMKCIGVDNSNMQFLSQRVSLYKFNNSNSNNNS